MRTLAGLAAMLLVACAAPPEPVMYSGQHGSFSLPAGWPPGMARSFGFVADAVAPRVAAELGLETVPRIDTTMLETPYLDGVDLLGWCRSFPTRIELGSACLERADDLDLILAHELLHAYFVEAGWRPVAYVVEEVMAEFVARQIDGKPVDEIVKEALEPTPAELESLLGLTNEAVSAATPENRQRMYRACLGFLQRVGWPRVLEMVRTGHRSNEDFLRAFQDEEP
jgi:hypothetical protein